MQQQQMQSPALAIRNPNLKLWSKSATGAGVGATTSFVAMSNTVTLRTGCKRIGGIIIAIGAHTTTAAKNAIVGVQLDSDALGWSKRQFQLPFALGDPIATNNQGMGIKAFFIPITNRMPPQRDFQGTVITFSWATLNAAFTGGWDVAVSVLQLSDEPDTEFKNALQTQCIEFCHSFSQGAGASTAGSAAATAFTTNPALIANDSLLIGIQPLISVNANTAGESAVALITLSDGDIEDFSPQEWPSLINFHASLGTPVGQPPQMVNKAFPTRFPLPRIATTVNATVTLVASTTNAVDAGVTLFTRQESQVLV